MNDLVWQVPATLLLSLLATTAVVVLVRTPLEGLLFLSRKAYLRLTPGTKETKESEGELPPNQKVRLVRAGPWVMGTLALALGVYCWSVPPRQWTWLVPWKSPGTLSVFLLAALFFTQLTGWNRRTRRQMRTFVRSAAVGLVAVALFQWLHPTDIPADLDAWSMRLAPIWLLLLAVLARDEVSSLFERYQRLETKRRQISKHRKILTPVAKLVARAMDDPEIGESLDVLRDAEKEARRHLADNELTPAEAALLHAARELEEIKTALRERSDTSLKECVQRILREAEADLETLRADVEQTNLDPSLLEELEDEIGERIEELTVPPSDLVELSAWARPIESVFEKLSNTRTALRFYRGTDQTFDDLKANVGQIRFRIRIAELLGVEPPEDWERVQQELLGRIIAFEEGEMKSYGTLVALFNNIRRQLRKYRELAEVCERRIEHGWHRARLDGLLAWIPERCGTRRPTPGLIVAVGEPDRAGILEAETNLLQLSCGPQIELSSTDDILDHPHRRFTVTGDRNAAAELTVRVRDDAGEVAARETWQVEIEPATTDLTEKIAPMAPVLGGVAGIGFWWGGMSVSTAVAVGGGLAGVLILIWILLGSKTSSLSLAS